MPTIPGSSSSPASSSSSHASGSTTTTPPAPSGSSGAAATSGAASTSSAGTSPPGTPSADAPPPSTGDGFDAGGGTTTTAALLRGGLPEVLLESASVRVVHGTDPGDFYCEHMFFRAQQHAQKPGSSVVKNEQGELLVGFLHVPWDRATSAPPPDGSEPAPYTQEERHDALSRVVGAALRGYCAAAAKRAAADEPLKLLVTGYGPFSTARNNPTGEFVSRTENLDRAMAHGFGSRLLTPVGEPQATDAADVFQLRYRVLDKDGGSEREVLVRLQRFPVADAAIDGVSEKSVQRAMDDFQPQAVLSLGVASGRDFRAEFHADDGGLSDSDGAARHDGSLAARVTLRDNYALARAIHLGGQAAAERPAVPLVTLLIGGDAPV